jgi:DNA-binding MarR family transcriptional regulator
MKEQVTEIFFYTLENAIKTYRKFAQKRINEANFDLTIDQWLVLQFLDQHHGISQKDLADAVFKDVASVTRIIDLLVKKGHLERAFHPTDRRRFELSVTEKGYNTLHEMQNLIFDNRNTALNGISRNEINSIQETLKKIIMNCK